MTIKKDLSNKKNLLKSQSHENKIDRRGKPAPEDEKEMTDAERR
jgi:hypothetical protein